MKKERRTMAHETNRRTKSVARNVRLDEASICVSDGV